MLLMVEIDCRDRSRDRGNHVRCIEASAESHFDHGDVDAGPTKQLERGCRRRLEERRRHWKHARPLQTLGTRQHVVDGRLEGGDADGFVVDDETLG